MYSNSSFLTENDTIKSHFQTRLMALMVFSTETHLGIRGFQSTKIA